MRTNEKCRMPRYETRKECRTTKVVVISCTESLTSKLEYTFRVADFDAMWHFGSAIFDTDIEIVLVIMFDHAFDLEDLDVY